MPEAKRDEVPLPEPIDAQWRRHRYTEDQLREHGRQCAQAERERCMAIVQQVDPHLADNEQREWILNAIRSQNLIKDTP